MMPHITIKLWPGKTEEQKAELTEALADNVCKILKVKPETISVTMVEVNSAEWTNAVYKPEIIGTPGKLYRKPGYIPQDL